MQLCSTNDVRKAKKKALNINSIQTSCCKVIYLKDSRKQVEASSPKVDLKKIKNIHQRWEDN